MYIGKGAMSIPETLPALYRDLAGWWYLLSPPEDYVDEARSYHQILNEVSSVPPRTLLELGSGGGSNAFHLKEYYQMTLVDLSAEMLAVSQKVNPECEHIQGDMRTVRLGRQFDAVFIHDAIGYMTTEQDLLQALVTAFEHCRPGGVGLFVPDHTRESFKASTFHGGNDDEGRSLRYLEWTFDPDPYDNTFVSYMAYMLRAGKDNVRCVLDRHNLGLFSHADWLRLIAQAGFEASALPSHRSDDEPGTAPLFLGIKPTEE
jgi:SAM-dependent methyltransferase